jgi:sigma-E factor negative regulatory protein RseB
MPVRTDLVDAHGRVLEQLLFTALVVGGSLPDSAFRPSLDATSYTAVRGPASRPTPSGVALDWHLTRVPPGFEVRSVDQQAASDGVEPVTHVVLSDGLAAISVFIEGPPPPPRQAVAGQGRVGTAFLSSRVVSGHQVTAVGEVPLHTVDLIAAGVLPPDAPPGALRAIEPLAQP